MYFQKVIIVTILLSLVDAALSKGGLRVNRDVNDKQIDDMIPLVGPRQAVDFVILIDRSRGMEMDNFYLREKRIIRSIIQNYATVSSEYVRIACLTFATDVEIVFDSISSNSTAINKGHIFSGSSRLWDDVLYYYDENRFTETNMKVALEEAANIFAEGSQRRIGVNQVLLMSTDGDYRGFDDTVAAADLLKASGVTIFGLGVGPWILGNAGNVAALVSRDGYYAPYATWVQMLSEQPTSYTHDTTPDPALFEAMSTDEGFCGGFCHENSQCYIDVDTGLEQCLCIAGYTPDTGALVQPACKPCSIHSYKSDPGNFQCRICPPPMFTNQTGSTAIDVCVCPIDVINAGTEHLDCIDQCDGACGINQDCIYTGTRTWSCDCQEGWMNTFPDNSDQVECIQNINDCSQNTCFGDANCVDLNDDFLCSCPVGFVGRYCEMEENPCDNPICLNGGTCTSTGSLGFNCACPYGWGERYCAIVSTTTSTTSTPATSTSTPTTTTSTTTSTTSTSTDQSVYATTTTASVEDETDTNIGLYAGIGVGVVALLIFILTILSRRG